VEKNVKNVKKRDLNKKRKQTFITSMGHITGLARLFVSSACPVP